MDVIADAKLTESDVPAPQSDWRTVTKFALTFNGYKHWGSFEQCADIANRGIELYEGEHRLLTSLAELRTCLFFEQRRWRHFGERPDSEALDYVQALVEAIREKVKPNEVD